METSEAEGEEAPRRGRRTGLLIVLAALALVLLVVLGFLGSLVPGEAPTPIADVSSERLLAQGAVVGFAADDDTHAWLGDVEPDPLERPTRARESTQQHAHERQPRLVERPEPSELHDGVWGAELYRRGRRHGDNVARPCGSEHR